MSFFGGGTDDPAYFNENEYGCVISTTFDKYCYVTIRKLPPFFEYKNELVYSQIERTKKVEDFKHPMVRETLLYFKQKGLRITYDADLPARSGLGTSSSFAVGLINALTRLQENISSKEDSAKKAIYIERVLCKEAGGWQDQVAASYGGFNKIVFSNNEFKCERLAISNERKNVLNNNLFLVFTGFTRYSSDVQKSCNVKGRNKILNDLKTFVSEAEKILCDNSIFIDEFGLLLHESWLLKKNLSKNISNNNIDDIYNYGIMSGAIGGKLLGAGAGGFILFYVPENNHQRFIEQMSNHIIVPFRFEEKGSEVLYEKY